MPKIKKRKMPKVGSVFEKQFNGVIYQLIVVKSKDGIAFKQGDHLYDTPTAAAKSIQKTEVNGWKFWKMDKNQ